jgi:putative chitinase
MSVLPPSNNTSAIIDDFITYATQHLTTVSGVITTVSLYPAAPTPVPGPGAITWTGYTVTPSVPTPPFPTANFDPNLVETPIADTTSIEMTDSQLAASEQASLNGSNINEATAMAFESDEEFTPSQIESAEAALVEDAENQPTPTEAEPIDDDIKQVPNYKTNVKVPPEMVVAMRKYGVGRTAIQRAHLLAQCAHESGVWIYKEEIASGAAYEGRKDLGNTQTGDGKRYKGRGYVQLTGRANYKKYGPVAGADFENNPTIVATRYFADTACMFWKSNKLDAKAVDSSETTIKVISKRINGGYNGLADRMKKFKLYWTELQKDPTLWS